MIRSPEEFAKAQRIAMRLDSDIIDRVLRHPIKTTDPNAVALNQEFYQILRDELEARRKTAMGEE